MPGKKQINRALYEAQNPYSNRGKNSCITESTTAPTSSRLVKSHPEILDFTSSATSENVDNAIIIFILLLSPGKTFTFPCNPSYDWTVDHVGKKCILLRRMYVEYLLPS